MIESKIDRWQFKEIHPKTIETFSKKFNLSPLLAKLLLMRNIGKVNEEEVEHFISPPEELLHYTQNLTSMTELEKGLSRLAVALKKGEKVMINGDPDADGITGAVVVTAALRYLGFYVLYDFPTRSKEGHGLQPRIIDAAKELNISLLITTDCGCKDVEAIDYAASRGVDVIVCDHHILGKISAKAYAMINPMCVPGQTAHKALSGAAVAFKFMLALFHYLKLDMPEYLFNFLLSTAALGTISDRMSLKDPFNRILVKKGIEALNASNREGLKALKEISASRFTHATSQDISRSIIPRLNAPGRIGDREEGIPDARIAVDLLLVGIGRKNAKKASQMMEQFSYVMEIGKTQKLSAAKEAALLDDVNEKRKFITTKIEDEIEYYLEQNPDIVNEKIIIVRGENWNPGVIGIDTDRLRDRFLRPCCIVTEYSHDDYIRGSVRSIPTIDMYRVIEAVGETFEARFGKKLFQHEVQSEYGKKMVDAFGGHSQACGFSFYKENLNAFLDFLRAEVAKLPEDQFHYSYEILDTLTFDQINQQLFSTLETFNPYGQDFEYPIFYLKDIQLSRGRPFGNRYQEARTPHVEFFVINPQNAARLNAVGYGLWEKFSKLYTANPTIKYDLIFTLEMSSMKSKKGKQHEKLRLNVLDVRSGS